MFLKPLDEHGVPKKYADYTKEERESAIIQIEESSRGRAATPEAVKLAHELRDGHKPRHDGDKILGGRPLEINTQSVDPLQGAAAAGRKN